MIPGKPDATVTTWAVRQRREVVVDAWTTGTPGLVIQQALDDSGRYVVTHQRSGLLVATPLCGCYAAAEQVADALFECGNWDRTGAEVVDDKELRRRATDVVTATGSKPQPSPVEDRAEANAARTKALAL